MSGVLIYVIASYHRTGFFTSEEGASGQICETADHMCGNALCNNRTSAPGAITAPVPRAITDRIGRPVKFVKKFEKVVDKLAKANYNKAMRLAMANQPVKADAQ